MLGDDVRELDAAEARARLELREALVGGFMVQHGCVTVTVELKR